MKDVLRFERDFATVLLFLVWGPIVIAYILWQEGRSSKREALKELERRGREVLEGRDWSALTHAEVARILGRNQ